MHACGQSLCPCVMRGAVCLAWAQIWALGASYTGYFTREHSHLIAHDLVRAPGLCLPAACVLSAYLSAACRLLLPPPSTPPLRLRISRV